MLAAFFWKQDAGRTIHWLAWAKICRGKTEGGLGMRWLKEFNASLLSKQTWRIMTRSNSLVHRMYKARYFPGTSFAQVTGNSNVSYAWRSLLATKSLLQARIHWQIGDGASVQITPSL
ncbi:UNVERIFIED_CONTAM: hypothetical protein Slati_0480400 [Sesamum latifolium]|uniref:Reverse transcriptase zinc-binding domain-containing protein n=1 Tax=Sesamum latifolium TaxID=2727402 RepID=A0AAW2XWL8_9LAMI